METYLDYNQKGAITSFLNYLCSNSNSFTNWNTDTLRYAFEDYELPQSANLDYSQYIFTLQDLPNDIKKDIICRILSVWAYATDKHFRSLYDVLQSLMYLKIGSGIECVMFNSIIKLADYFGFKNTSFHLVASYEDGSYYVSIFIHNKNNTMIDFYSSKEYEIPRLYFNLPEDFLKTVKQYDGPPTSVEVSELMESLAENSTKKHCPWVFLDFTLNCEYFNGYTPFLRFSFNDIKYEDNYG